MSDVFISYSRRDKKFVHILHDALENSAKKTWVDWEDILPTSEWWQEIEKAIAGSDTFIFVISPASIASEYCNKEVEYAFNLHKRILPIVRQDVTDITQVQAALSRHQWIFFRESDDFEIAFQRLLEAIALDLPHIHAHTKLLVRAIEWENKQRKDGFLLRGEDLEEAEKWLMESEAKSPKPTEIQVVYIQSSHKIEDANQQANKILKKKARNGILIAIICGTLAVSGSIAAFVFRNYEVQKARNTEFELTKKVMISTSQLQQNFSSEFAKNAEEAENAIKDLESKYQILVSERNSDISMNQKNKNGVIFIQVPSNPVKERIINLPISLKDSGYAAYGIEVVGKVSSPNSYQIRYFFENQKSRAEALQKKLEELGYKDFTLQYIEGLEDKANPDLLEIWFAKDAK